MSLHRLREKAAFVKRVLVTGGAGYIGSHTVRALVDAGYQVTVIDLLRTGFGTGNRSAVPPGVRLLEGSCGDIQVLERAWRESGGFEALIHFAALILVDESMREPARYYENNVVCSLRLFDFALRRGVKSLVFSSTAATYGNYSEMDLIPESAPLAPINPYGRSKLMTETVLRDLLAVHPAAHAMILRYFNPAGARLDRSLGQMRPVATHLVNVAAEAAVGRREVVRVFGADYPTSDGTCVRDYIHIEDVADAHVLALEALAAGAESVTLNVGYGRPYSVLEVLAEMKRVSGVPFRVEVCERRPGDPPFLAADPSLIKRLLGWTPRHDSLETICRTQFLWEKKRESLTI